MLSLLDSVGMLSGVGPKRELALNHLDIYTIYDLINYFPTRYKDLEQKLPSETLDGEKVTFKGIVSSDLVLTRFGQRKTRVNFRLLVEHDNIMVTFFNQPWLQGRVETGAEVAIYGTYDKARQSLAGIKFLAQAATDELEAVYPASKEIQQRTIRSLVEQALGKYKDVIEENLVPTTIRQRYKLLDHGPMIMGMHFPKTPFESQQARRTASFEEFFLFQTRLQIIKQMDRANMGRAVQYDNQRMKGFIKQLPYELTNAQKRVVNEIVFDMKRPVHMNRLLQGDVGSGKTIVAALAMYAAVTANMQAVMMAPTEILAQQHARSIGNLFDPTEVRVELLTGSTPQKIRRQLLEDLRDGEIDILIGTHALIQPDIEFHNLGLAVIDEQHRFGVQQRATLRDIGMNPDVLAMTATPIPRTLAITAYGEMDVSLLDEMPAGRKPIETTWVRENEQDNAFDLVAEQLGQGAQAYIVTPLIEESEALEVQNAEQVFAEVQEQFAPRYKVGILHGRMTNQEKDATMAAFKANELQILVATTVIEVGVDVPNATVMMIMDADRFGLAQLHQLRGRVGRGDRQSYAILVAEPKTQYGIDRMKVMTQTNDGFVLAQKDLELRGTGDVLGKRQSGMPAFRVGDPVHDMKMMEVAQQEAIRLISEPDWDQQPDNVALAEYMSQTMERYRFFD